MLRRLQPLALYAHACAPKSRRAVSTWSFVNAEPTLVGISADTKGQTPKETDTG